MVKQYPENHYETLDLNAPPPNIKLGSVIFMFLLDDADNTGGYIIEDVWRLILNTSTYSFHPDVNPIKVMNCLSKQRKQG